MSPDKVYVLERYTPCGVDLGKIVRRIIRYAPQESTEGLSAVVLLDTHPTAFGCYRKESSQIELYVQEIIGWLPLLLRKSYVIPYLFIGLALGHELDHHANREQNSMDQEAHAEADAMKYVYPSLGVFKSLLRFLAVLSRRSRVLNNQQHPPP